MVAFTIQGFVREVRKLLLFMIAPLQFGTCVQDKINETIYPGGHNFKCLLCHGTPLVCTVKNDSRDGKMCKGESSGSEPNKPGHHVLLQVPRDRYLFFIQQDKNTHEKV